MNQLLISVFCEECNTYPPIPKTILPLSIIPNELNFPPIPNMKCPNRQNMPVKMRIIRAPYLSIRIPPIRGTMILGKA